MDLWNTIKGNNLCTTGVPEGKEKEKEAENLFKEIMAENFPNLGRNLDIQIHEDNSSPHNFNLKQFSLSHIIIKLPKIEKRILKAARETNFSQTREPL